MGSPCYLSPEIVQGASYSYKSDVWSLGVILYRMATNKFPFDAQNLAQLALKITAGSFPPLSPNYSPQAHHLVALLLQIVPELRGSMAEIVANLYVQQHVARRRHVAAAAPPAAEPPAASTEPSTASAATKGKWPIATTHGGGDGDANSSAKTRRSSLAETTRKDATPSRSRGAIEHGVRDATICSRLVDPVLLTRFHTTVGNVDAGEAAVGVVVMRRSAALRFSSTSASSSCPATTYS